MENTKSKDNLREDSAEGHLSVSYKNYITPDGHTRLMEIVSWAAGNGDRSENGDYIYGKKRLREIDKRIHYLTKRLDIAEIVDPAIPREDEKQIFFGATVTFSDLNGGTETVSIVGVDEIDTTKGYISWVSPMAKALIKSRQGDVVSLHTPAGVKEIEILKVKYRTIPAELFKPVTK
jgi:transcription elongation factor GreB